MRQVRSLDKVSMQLYWKLLGMLQWAAILGRIDVMCATITMGGFRAQPRQGHQDKLKRFFEFLRHQKKGADIFKTEMINYSKLPGDDYNWKYVYGNVREEILYNMPNPKGKEVKITMFVDANLYHDKVTGRSFSGLLMMLNGTCLKNFLLFFC